jgi:membrane protein DedA with SNARE-associated domain
MFSIDTMINFYSSFGYISVFGVLLLCGFGLPIPEDLTILVGGIISGLGYTNPLVMGIVCFIGVLIGDVIVYNMGRFFGESLFNTRLGKRLLSHSWYDRIVKSFAKNGKMVLLTARFLPGLRTPIFLTAGMTRFAGFGTFVIIDGLAALVSIPIWITIGYFGASNREHLTKWISNTKWSIGLIIVLVVVIYIICKKIKQKLINAELVETDITSYK